MPELKYKGSLISLSKCNVKTIDLVILLPVYDEGSIRKIQLESMMMKAEFPPWILCQYHLGHLLSYKTSLDTKSVLYQDRFCIFYRGYEIGFVPKRVNTKLA